MPKTFEMIRLAPEQIHFERRGDTLALKLGEEADYPRVVLRCCFPVSQEQLFLSVRDASTEEQDEIGMIEDWTTLREVDRQAVAAELGLHYFVPQIQRVLKIKDEFGFLYWTIETDKGPKDFVMRNSIVHYAREVGPNHWLLIDVNQARYEIPDLTRLDARSQALVKRFLYL
jgi:hypothetical protein